MFKHPMCGGKHETTSEARACEQMAREQMARSDARAEGSADPGMESNWSSADRERAQEQHEYDFQDRVIGTPDADRWSSADRERAQFMADRDRRPVDRSQNLPSDVQAQARRDAYGRPARTATLPAVVTEDGIYLSPLGEIFKVVFNKASGSGRRLYAKKLVIWDDNVPYSADLLTLPAQTATGSRMEWAYTPGAMREIRPDWKMNAADAERFGKLYGRCFKCHRVLTKEESIARSMGDTCAGKQGF
jgi:hypothetical protein